MKQLLVLLALLLLQTAAGHARDTAYQALRVLSAAKGDGVLDQVLEVQGRSGIPQPKVWRILLDDPAARAGIREVEVADGRVLSERTPVRGGFEVSELPMDFQRLNLDSDGAFSIADQEAKKARVGFDSVDFFLRGEPQTPSPVWLLHLHDARGRVVGVLHIAAETGAVRRVEGMAPSGSADRPEPRPSRDEQSVRRGHGEEFVGKVQKAGNRIEKHFMHMGGRLQKFFTGRRTIDREYRENE